MTAALHCIRHWLHCQPIEVVSEWQPIEVVSEWRGTDLWIGARCVVCGEVTGWHRSHVRKSHMP